MKKVSLSFLLLVGVLVGGFILGYAYFSSRQQKVPAITSPVETESGLTDDAPGPVIRNKDLGGFNEVVLDLKQDYFDDLLALWGSGTESGEFIGEGFDSEYAARSAPRPINHPIEIKQEKIVIERIKPNEIGRNFSSDNSDNYFLSLESKAKEENSKKYGKLIGEFFAEWSQEIDSVEEADVDRDGIPEKLVTTSDIGANHPPHHAHVVKDNVIIASVELISGYIKPAKDGNGFYVKDPSPVGDWGPGMSYLFPLCCPVGYRIYRAVFEDGRFVPVWEQDIPYLQFKQPE